MLNFRKYLGSPLFWLTVQQEVLSYVMPNIRNPPSQSELEQLKAYSCFIDSRKNGIGKINHQPNLIAP